MEQVIVVGAGPVGLWLAAELRLGGAEVTVLEARHARDPHSKALTVHPRTLEVFALRGVVDRFLAEGRRIPDGHFGGLDERMSFAGLDTPFPFTLALPQARTEELVEDHARAAGARIRRGHKVTGLTQDEHGVTVRAAGPQGSYEMRASYVVGCDGTRSTVREAAGIDFPGTDATTWGWLGDVVLDEPPHTPVLNVSGPHGGLMVVPLPDGVHRIVGGDPEGRHGERPGPLTLDELRAKVTRIAGSDFGMHTPSWLSRFGNAARQAAHYRAGRVLLAGDAAHMHYPAGGVGMNVGIQDATNLGWKLAATVRGAAPESLLDTYHAERHPVGADLLLSTRAQTALMNAHTPEIAALRTLLAQCIATVPAFSLELAGRLSALAVAYPAPGKHPLTGRRAPDLALNGTGLFALLRPARHVLLDLTGAGVLPGPCHRAAPAEPPAEWSKVRAALVRPDGHVAWACDETDDAALARAAREAVAAAYAG
ncbi:FAD-dependent monooxygenase [Streptomyces sp. SGAir0957]